MSGRRDQLRRSSALSALAIGLANTLPAARRRPVLGRRAGLLAMVPVLVRNQGRRSAASAVTLLVGENDPGRR